ncbi:MAG: aspartate aminotransferase family protein [Salibacteraceae bacterium]
MGLEIAFADGCYLTDTSGKKYVDLISGIGVANIGHRHPEVVKAIREQTERYLHVIPFGEFSQKPQNDLADALAEILPGSLNSVYFVNSGTEANEAALKLAKRATGRTEIVAMKRSYHGATHGSLSVTGNETKKQRFRPLVPGTKFIEFNCIDSLKHITTNTAAVIVEPVQGDAGVRIPAASYLKAIRQRCDETGALLIFDEVQTGMGRTGKFFSFEHFGAVPDILTLAKSLGGGMPIGAFISSSELMHLLTHNPPLGHITTFGGHPVCCAAALACVRVLSNEPWIEECRDKGMKLKEIIAEANPTEVRQIGLMMAVELNTEHAVNSVIETLLDMGYISFYFLSSRNAFRLAPPLCITHDEIALAGEAIATAISRLGNH